MVNNNKNRLGRKRRDSRYYSLHQRSTGKFACDRVKESIYFRAGSVLFVSARSLMRRGLMARAKQMEGVALGLLTLVWQIQQPRLRIVDTIPKRDVRIESFSEQRTEAMYGFSQNELRQVFDRLQFPVGLKIGTNRHAFTVPGEKAFLYMLYRFHSPVQRMSLDSDLFGYDYSVLSKIFTAAVEFTHVHHQHRLHSIDSVKHKFGHFNSKIVGKIRSQGYPIPPDAVNCALFADAARIRISRPSGEYFEQQAYYSGHKHYHNVGLLGVMAPDGIIYEVYDEPVGRHQDRHYMAHSLINEKLHALQLHDARQFWMYTDRGFTTNTHVRAAAHGPGPVTEQEHANNWIMSKERITEEWCFGKVYARCPLLNHAKKLKLKDIDVRVRVQVAVLLTNIHTTLKHSQVSEYFACGPPTLAQYLA